MKKLLFLVFLISLNNIFAQNNLGKTDDLGRIELATILNKNIPQNASKLLENKVSQIITRNGLGGSSNSRFVVAVNVVEVTKDITATAPPMHAYTLDVNFYIADGIEGTVFSSTSIQVKGVGATDDKAYIAALKNVKPADMGLKSMIETGKNKIVEYYNLKCDFILKEADVAMMRSQYDEAYVILGAVPNICKDCFSMAQDKMTEVYKKKLNEDASKIMNEAKSAWGQKDVETALNILATMPYGSSLEEDKEKLVGEITAYVEKVQDEAKKAEMKREQREFELRKQQMINDHQEMMSAINAEVQMAKEAAKQPVYNIIWW